MHQIPYIPKKARICLECFREQILEQFSSDASYLLDAIDHILEKTTKEERMASDEKRTNPI